MYAKLKTSIIALIIILITAAIMTFPEQTLKASVHGLHTWWEIVFPSLLPFFIMAELLICFGIVQFFGVLFEPVMRPLFNVPGAGSFAWLLGMVSGFPSGAKITVLLRKNNDITQVEAERLLAFSNAASPLFIFGAIAVGFFHSVHLGFIIASSHYASNIIVGLIMKYYKLEKCKRSKHDVIKYRQYKNIIHRAFSRMHETRIQETRPFGEMFGDAVITSIQTLLMIGGFIILFSVFTSLLQVVHFIRLIELIFITLWEFFHIPSETIPSLVTGFFEITMGANAVSQTSLPLIWQLVLISFMLGFNGLSIQAQVASLIAKTDIRFQPYFMARLLHSIIASLMTFLLYHFYFQYKSGSIQTISMYGAWPTYIEKIIAATSKVGPIITLISLFVATAILFNRLTRST